MKKFLILAVLMLALVVTAVACGGDSNTAETNAATNAATEAATDAATEAAGTQVESTVVEGTQAEGTEEAGTEVAGTEVEATEAGTAVEGTDVAVEGTDATQETEDLGEDEDREFTLDDEIYKIYDAEDLMALAALIDSIDIDRDDIWEQEDGLGFWDKTIEIMADIDMEGEEWKPLNGRVMDGVIFNGNNHKISNLKFVDWNPEVGIPAENMGYGFIDVARGVLTFNDLTLENSSIVAFERAVGNFIGLVRMETEGTISFTNCHSIGFTVDGWLDKENEDITEGIRISFRQAGFIGHMMAGSLAFDSCTVKDISLKAFHNMAGFIGYDGTNTVTEYTFTNCRVENATFTFGYGSSYDITTEPRKFVSIFFNAGDWANKLPACEAVGNTWENVTYIDWYNDDAQYLPGDFVTPPAEEEVPAA